MIKTYSKRGILSHKNKDYMQHYEYDNIVILGMADGASCCLNSDLATSVLIETLSLYLGSGNWTDIDINVVKQGAVNIINQTLTDIAIKKTVDRETLGSTLMLLCIMQDQYMCIHVGDGMIIRRKHDDRAEIISYPHNGIDRSSTYLTTGNIEENLRIYTGVCEKKDIFYMLTDGYYNPLLKNENNYDIIVESLDVMEKYMASTIFYDDVSIMVYENFLEREGCM